LVLLSFTRNLRVNAELDLRVNAELERAYLKAVKEGYNLRATCLIAMQRLPAGTESTEEEESGQEQEETAPSQSEGRDLTGTEKSSEGQQTPEKGASLPVEKAEAGKEKKKSPVAEGSLEEQKEKEEQVVKKNAWKPRHEPYSLELGGKPYHVFIEDEASKLNVNLLTKENRDIFERLLMVRGIDQQDARAITDNLLDWLDEDDRAQTSDSESKYYASLSEPYPPRNGPLTSLEELILVKGVSPEVYERIKNDLTIYGNEMKIDINSASREVIYAIIGISLEEAYEVVTFVKEEGSIVNIDELRKLLFGFGVAGKDFQKISALIRTTASPYTSVRSKGSTARQYRLVVNNSDKNILAVYPE
jgi:general secretion pathway protein K